MNLSAALLIVAMPALAAAQVDLGPWPQHSRERPMAPVVTPGAQALPVAPPSDAVVLFDGKDLSKWTSNGAPAKWKVVGDAFEVVPGTGALSTRDSFGDCQLHIEWMTPSPPKGTDQDRGNSGVFFGGGRYEVQVLDSYKSVTYADGQAGALYGQHPPLVNASRPPGEWQSYDIIYHAPHFDAAGKVTAPTRFTVFHNGILIQDDAALVGPTANMSRPPYVAHPASLPLQLQDHEHPVRFRNIWLRPLTERSE